MSRVYKTKEERYSEIKPIISKLSELKMNTEYNEIKELFKIMQLYINTGENININIPFLSYNTTIKGVLNNLKNVKIWVKLEYKTLS
jgi:hypothetical protein